MEVLDTSSIMSSMWKGGQQDAQNGDQLAVESPLPIPQEDGASPSSRRSHEPARRSHDEPTERTRLLDRPRPPPNADGYLDPDDPAVSVARLQKGEIKMLIKIGIAIQPLDGACYALPNRALPGPHLLVVGTPAGFHLRLSAWSSYSRIGLL